MSSREISNSDDIVDSRDVIARIEELESLRDDWQEDNELPDYQNDDWTDEQANKWTEWDVSEEGQELEVLKDLAEQCEGYGDWEHGESLLRDSYMDAEWAEQEVKNLGYLPNDLQWLISSNINWQGVLEDLQQDYISVEWDGVTYWMRS